jgi:hypothetical protein
MLDVIFGLWEAGKPVGGILGKSDKSECQECDQKEEFFHASPEAGFRVHLVRGELFHRNPQNTLGNSSIPDRCH